MENKEHNLGYIQYANGNYAGTLNSRNKNLWQNKMYR